jgi:hypothetical protein
VQLGIAQLDIVAWSIRYAQIEITDQFRETRDEYTTEMKEDVNKDNIPCINTSEKGLFNN